MDELTDEQLMLLVKHDNAEAFDRLFRRHGRRLLGYLSRTCGDRGDAEDLVQEVFLAVFRARKDWRPVARFSTWLYTMARNARANRWKQGMRERARTAGFAAERIGPGRGAAPACDGPPQRLAAGETEAAVASAIARLPARQREVLLLREVAGLAYEEIAEVASLALGTVKTELHRARRRLAGILDDLR